MDGPHLHWHMKLINAGYMVIIILKKKNSMRNSFWKEVVQSMYDLRKIMKPIKDHDYLTWPIWHEKTLRLPEIRKLKVGSCECGSRPIRLNLGSTI